MDCRDPIKFSDFFRSFLNSATLRLRSSSNQALQRSKLNEYDMGEARTSGEKAHGERDRTSAATAPHATPPWRMTALPSTSSSHVPHPPTTPPPPPLPLASSSP
ncbi:Os07g0565350, partial [Oryza sativa Japonica Group]